MIEGRGRRGNGPNKAQRAEQHHARVRHVHECVMYQRAGRDSVHGAGCPTVVGLGGVGCGLPLRGAVGSSVMWDEMVRQEAKSAVR